MKSLGVIFDPSPFFAKQVSAVIKRYVSIWDLLEIELEDLLSCKALDYRSGLLQSSGSLWLCLKEGAYSPRSSIGFPVNLRFCIQHGLAVHQNISQYTVLLKHWDLLIYEWKGLGPFGSREGCSFIGDTLENYS